MFSIWLASSYQGGNGSAAGRIALVLVAMIAVGAFALLQVRARWRRRGRTAGPLGQRRYDPSDWRTWPPPSWSGGPDEEAPSGREEEGRPGRGYAYPPGYEPYPRYDPSRSPWVAREEPARDRSLGALAAARPVHSLPGGPIPPDPPWEPRATRWPS